MVSIKKTAMKHVWRLQQVGGILSVMMLSITNALLIKDKVNYRFMPWYDGFGLPSFLDYDYVVSAVFAMAIFVLALLAGYLYDRTFQMWKAQNEVAVERNPYAKVMLTPKEIVIWRKNTIPMLRGLGKKDEADFMERWIDRILKENPMMRNDVAAVEAWVKP
jgi:hypothetical protein